MKPCLYRINKGEKNRFFLNAISFIFQFLGIVLVIGLNGSTTSAESEPVSLDVYILIDSSGSMRENDPTQLRVSAAKFLVDYLYATGGAMGASHRVAIANFDTSIIDKTALTQLNADSIKQIKTLQPVVRGNTDFRPALEFVIQQINNSTTSWRKPLVLLITDGEAYPGIRDLTEDEADRYFKNEVQPLVTQIQDKGGQVNIISIANKLMRRDDRVRWINLAGVNNENHLTISETSALFETFDRLTTRAIGKSREAPYSITADKPFTFTVSPYLDSLFITTIKKEPQTSASVLLDSNKVGIVPYAGGGAEQYAIYYISAPQPGSWTSKISQGANQVLIHEQPAQILWSLPAYPIGVGEIADIRIEIRTRNPDRPNAALQLELQLKHPTQAPQTINMMRHVNGAYTALPKLTSAGVYSLSVTAKLNEQKVDFVSDVVTLTAYAVPSLTSIELPYTLYPATTTPITVNLLNAVKIGKDAKIIATIDSIGDKEKWDIRQLTVDTQGKAVGSLTLPKVSGSYILQVYIEGQTIDGVPISTQSIKQQILITQSTPLVSTPSAINPTAIPAINASATPNAPVIVNPPTSTNLVWVLGLLVTILAGSLVLLAMRSRHRFPSNDGSPEHPTSDTIFQSASSADREAFQTLNEIRNNEITAQKHFAAGDFKKAYGLAREATDKLIEHRRKENTEFLQLHHKIFTVMLDAYSKISKDGMKNE